MNSTVGRLVSQRRGGGGESGGEETAAKGELDRAGAKGEGGRQEAAAPSPLWSAPRPLPGHPAHAAQATPPSCRNTAPADGQKRSGGR
eukprot:364280-Chlamydomonas_euryale.AAC.21